MDFLERAQNIPLSPSLILKSHPFTISWHQIPVTLGPCLALVQLAGYLLGVNWTVCASDSYILLLEQGSEDSTHKVSGTMHLQKQAVPYIFLQRNSLDVL